MGRRKTKNSKHTVRAHRKRTAHSLTSEVAGLEPIIDTAIVPRPWPDAPPSVRYSFVRARQLEGTYPGEANTGTWPITAKRISYGWGAVHADEWPDSVNDGQWPPDEPAGVDRVAKRMRSGHYQRVRSLQDCRLALVNNQFPLAAIKITDAWFHVEKGMIPDPTPDDKIIGSHAVTLVGYDDQASRLRFRNSWGPDWGEGGFGDTVLRIL